MPLTPKTSTAQELRAHVQNSSVQKESKRNWGIILLVTAVCVVIISAIVRVALPAQEPPQQSNTWNGATPGYALTDSVLKKLGQPLTSRNTPEGQELSFSSQFPSKPNTIIVDDSGTVSFIKEHIAYDSNHTLAQYTTQYGEPSFSLFVPEISLALEAHVFLDAGLVVITHQVDNSVEQKWYFEPTTKEAFLQSWGKDLSTEQGHQE